VKGAFMLNGEVYLALVDGSFVKRSFDGRSWGAPVAVNTADQITPLTAWADDIRSMTSLFYDSGRIYFTRAKSNQLFFRYFTPESRVVGANRFVASSAVPGISFDQVRGMFVAGDRLYFSSTRQSQLRSIRWARGPISGAPVAGTDTVVSGGGVDQNSWTESRSPFLFQDASGENAGGTAPTQPPTASFTASCVELTCEFDGSSSAPGTGSITSYSWSFGDGSTATGAAPRHTYADAGAYTVTLTVTNSEGSTSSSAKVVQPTAPTADRAPVASFTASCSTLTCTFDGRASSDPDGDALTYAWEFGDGTTGVGATAAHTYADTGSYAVTLTVTAGGESSSTTRTVSPSEAGVVHVAATSSNGNRTVHPVTVPGSVENGDQLLLLMTLNNTTSRVQGPDGWSLVPGGAVDGNNMRQLVWTKVATAGDTGSVVRVTTSEYTKSDLSLAAYRATPGAQLSVTTSAGAVGTPGLSAYATPEAELPATGSSWVVSYWAGKASEPRSWTVPSTEVTRTSSAGGGGGGIFAVLADAGEGANSPRGGGLVATLNAAASQAQTFTVVLTAETSG
jgi:PKD repeat protein